MMDVRRGRCTYWKFVVYKTYLLSEIYKRFVMSKVFNLFPIDLRCNMFVTLTLVHEEKVIEFSEIIIQMFLIM